MPQKFNTEFNYRYQVKGDTVWEKIKTLQGFLEGRENAARLEEVGKLKLQARREKVQHLKDTNAPQWQVTEAIADLKEMEHVGDLTYAFELNRQEIEIIKQVMKELYEIAEPTRIPGYTDEQMFEVNAANEFTAMIGKEMYAEMLANGRPSAVKIHNAMSNPVTWNALKNAGLIPAGACLLEPSVNPLRVELKATSGSEEPAQAIEDAK